MIPDPTLERWLPVGFTLNSDQTSVHWCDFGHHIILEPFFNQTLRKLKALACPERASDLNDLIDRAHTRPPLNPSGLIFHISRCGSTLLANALRTGVNVVALSEARPIISLFRPHAFSQSGIPTTEWEGFRRLLLDSVVRLYASADHTSQVVIKCCAANVLHIPLIRTIWPMVPTVIVIRDPVEVMISNLATPAGWLRTRDRPHLGPNMFGWSDSDRQSMSQEEYCARGIGQFCELARRAVDERCRVIDYSNINVRSIYQIAELFRLTIPSPVSTVLTRVFNTYAKDPGETRPFISDSNRKQSEATDTIRCAAHKWADPHYRALRALERWD
jgi:hypothetical protein